MKKLKALHLLCAAVLGSQLALAEPAWPPDTFSCYYGGITPQAVEELKNLDLLVVHPGDDFQNLNKEKIEKLRETGKDKTIVAYVSVGEDDRPPGGPPIQGMDTSGPTYVGSDLVPKKAKNGYPAEFVDQRKFVFDENGFPTFGPDGKPVMEKGQDGHPDENGVWGSFYVKADEKAWKEHVFSKMDKLVELGVDGFFLDTVDTASPWGDYGWTSEGMLGLVQAVRDRYPQKKIVANRGLFYLSQNDKYAKLIDAVLFESLLTHYNWEADTGDISPWARWHVQALDDDVVPSQKRTGLHLLVLDYLNPKQKNALALVQSDRTLLANSTHSLSFSHPALQVTGWTPQDLLPDSAPASWPTLTKLEFQPAERGAYTLTAMFDSEIPEEALPDLRITTRDDVKAERAAQLATAQVTSWEKDGQTLTIKGNGLNKSTEYRAFLRLISRSKTPQTSFGWTTFQTQMSDRPSQVQEVSSSSTKDGLSISFKADSMVAALYRIYRVEGNQRILWAESKTSPVILTDPVIGQVYDIEVVAVNEFGEEGFPSELTAVVRQDVTPPTPPGEVTVSQEDETTKFSWQEHPDSSSYRLYVIPKGKTFRLPAVVSETEFEVDNVVPGTYKVFITAVDGAGNQSKPGPAKEIKIE